MAAALARSILTVRSISISSSSIIFPKRLISFSSTISKPPPLAGFTRPARSTITLTHSLKVYAPSAVRLNQVRCRVNRSGGAYSPLNSGSNYSDRPPTEMAPLFPGCDYEHWLIVMDKPGGENASKDQMIRCYIDTLAKVLGSEEEAKKKIYNVSCERYFGFGCEIDEETSNKLEGLPGVLFVRPDSYVDAENKDYGAIKKFNMQQHNNKSVNKLESSWVKPIQVIPEPYFCSSLQNLFLYFPGCIAVDESNERLFISDSNHHRIIVSNGSGEILESIGASPGFEDGEFQWAKLNRPAASFYHTAEDCLYFVDSENHAIRRADMERRVVETLYPMCNINNKRYSLWSWIVDKIWPSNDPVTKSDTHDSETILYPWHMMKSVDDLYIFTHSLETLWIMDLASGDIKDVVKGFSKIWEICGQMILEKSALLKKMPLEWLQQQVGPDCPLEGVQYASLMSSVATYQDHVVVCDAVGHRLLKLNKTSGSVASFQFSNFGILGLPYWCSYSLERVYAIDVQTSCRSDHIQQFSLLPGRIEIQLIVDIPEDTVLVEQLKEDYVWWQARGTATVVPEAKKKEEPLEKVGVAQQWYNELDDLAALTPKEKLSTEKEEMISDGKVQEGKICIRCAINTSPGTCEVIISAAIYLKLKILSTSIDDNREKYASRIAHHLSNTSGRSIRDQCLEQLLTSNADVRDLIFMKPLNVKLLFECLNHPKAKNSKDIILTNSSIDVNVSLT